MTGPNYKCQIFYFTKNTGNDPRPFHNPLMIPLINTCLGDSQTISAAGFLQQILRNVEWVGKGCKGADVALTLSNMSPGLLYLVVVTSTFMLYLLCTVWGQRRVVTICVALDKPSVFRYTWGSGDTSLCRRSLTAFGDGKNKEWLRAGRKERAVLWSLQFAVLRTHLRTLLPHPQVQALHTSVWSNFQPSTGAPLHGHSSWRAFPGSRWGLPA